MSRSAPVANHTLACSTAVRITKVVSGLISPVCSANGTNSSGEISPNVGWCHRTNASKPVTCSFIRSSLGW